MADIPDAHEEPTVPAAKPVKKKSRKKWLLLPGGLIVLPIVVFSLWAWVTLGWVYSSGDRAGYVQKLSKKGWLCKTWEGELAQVPLPGVAPQIFYFTVRNDSIAALLQKEMGKLVSLTYDEHRGVPTNCFGETGHFVTNVQVIQR